LHSPLGVVGREESNGPALALTAEARLRGLCPAVRAAGHNRRELGAREALELDRGPIERLLQRFALHVPHDHFWHDRLGKDLLGNARWRWRTRNRALLVAALDGIVRQRPGWRAVLSPRLEVIELGVRR